MQHHGCSFSRPQFYDNHMKCIHVSTALPNNAPNGVVSKTVFPTDTQFCAQFNYYDLRKQVSSKKKTDPKYPHMMG